MVPPWDRRIRRAEQLAADNGPVAPLLGFYARLLRTQKDLYDSFDRTPPSGSLDQDLELVRRRASTLLHDVAESGPDQLVVEARSLLESADSAIDDMLRAYWRAPSDRRFFAKAILQPYAQWLADAGIRLTDRTRADNRCPRCGGTPQLSILDQTSGTSTDGGGRSLLCAVCLTPWSFRRVLCPSCGEEDERKLGYFQSPAFDHVRVDACESCHHYLKTIDLGRLGVAVPLVDEVAAAPLDLWAHEHGYEKMELNLVGL
jgi:formate dehydrogenase accessory protein FdhE